VNASGVNDGEFFIGDVGSNVFGASTVRLMIDNNGYVGIGSVAGSPPFSNVLTLPNTASPAGQGLANAWTKYSSIRWKMNIQLIQGALNLIQRLRGVRFNWRADGKEDIDLVAEEVGEVVPEIVTYERNGKDAQSLDYSRLVPVTVEAIKGLNEKNEKLEAENNTLRETLQAENKSLRKENKGLRERLEAVERKLGLEN
jgi:FtsZ-binding cell division protein ZapB